MDVYKEKVEYLTPFLSARIIRVQKTGNQEMTRWNIHKETELLLILHGGMDIYIEQTGYPLRTGDVLLIPSNIMHRSQKHHDEHDLIYLVLQFEMKQVLDRSSMIYMPYFFNPLNSLTSLNHVIMVNSTLRQKISDKIQLINVEAEKKEAGFELAISNSIRSILLLLLRSDPNLNERRMGPILERLLPALDYIEEHLNEPLKTSDISRLLNMSYYHTAHLFKKAIGMSMVEYMNYKRIKRAEILLTIHHRTVSQAAYEVGIHNLSHFNRLFKRWNDSTPKAFQLAMRGPDVESSSEERRPTKAPIDPAF
ncbi:helix-turn-helix domain-containing protein [Paenibacillus shunpengii]|uniref:Helix-turn-helix domain-containing protein n=1 Tax=Paenibacillus shunpengii TaxID=2054424 RepID=A0ABW5SSK2_9BACL|nr:AraC family transcriptional regulator [Paenibacillus sp. PDC88]SDX20035.1 AraC-type DNA-binding protein [Paenibacillus sp. PDC88]